MTDTRYPNDPSPGNAGPDDPPPFRCHCGSRRFKEHEDGQKVECCTCGAEFPVEALE